MVILAHFHALSSFVYGCGINAEVDSEDGHTFHLASPTQDAPDSPSQSLSSSGGHGTGQSNGLTTGSSEEGGGIEVLMERMRRLTEEAQEEMTQEELQKRFERVETQSAECEFSLLVCLLD